MKFLLPILFCLSAMFAHAQDLKYEMSEPIDVSTAGWDRVLQMSNGNTLFFHFELRKGIIVKVFDKTRKEISSRKHVCSHLNINTLDNAAWIGLECFGNEGVLFISQEVENRTTLLRLRFNGNTGSMVAEEKLVQSPSFQRSILTNILREKGTDNYYVVCNKTNPGYSQKEIKVIAYDSKHTAVKEVPLNVDAKNFDDMNLSYASIDDKGNISLAVELTKIKHHPDVLERTMLACLLPKDANAFSYSKVELPYNYRYFRTILDYNPFSKNYQLHTTFQLNGYKEFGLSIKAVEYDYNALYIIDPNMELTPVAQPNSKVKAFIQSKLDTNYIFNGRTREVFMSDNGVSTVIYDGLLMPKTMSGHFDAKGTKRVIGITQFNERGQEIFGTTLSRSKLKCYKSPYLFSSNDGGITLSAPSSLQHLRNVLESDPETRMEPKLQGQHVIKNPFLIDANNEGQLCDMQCIRANNQLYVLFNETISNFGKTITDIPDSTYNTDQISAAFYRIGKKREITKAYLFGDPQANEYNQVLASSAHFDEKNNLYATVIRHRNGKDTKTKIAWVQL